MSRRRSSSTVTGPPEKDVVMGPPPVPSPLSSQASTGQPKTKGDQEIAEKYRKLKRRYFELEEKHKDTSTELQRSSERNVKMREERNILLDRIIELESQPVARANGSSGDSSAHPMPPYPATGAFPRSLLSARARTSFISNLRQAVAEDGMDEDVDPLLTSRHVGPTARKRAEEEKRERMEEDAREARRVSRRGRGSQQQSSGSKGKETSTSGANQPLMTFAPATGPHHHTGPGVHGSLHNATPTPTLVSSSGTRLRIKPPAPPIESASPPNNHSTSNSSSASPSTHLSSHFTPVSYSHPPPPPPPPPFHHESQGEAFGSSHAEEQPDQDLPQPYSRSPSPVSGMLSSHDHPSPRSTASGSVGAGHLYSPKSYHLRSSVNGDGGSSGNGISNANPSESRESSGGDAAERRSVTPNAHESVGHNGGADLIGNGENASSFVINSGGESVSANPTGGANGDGSVGPDVNMHSPSSTGPAENIKPVIDPKLMNQSTNPSPKQRPSVSPALQSNPYSHLTGSLPPAALHAYLPPIGAPGPSTRPPAEVQRHAKPKRLKAHTVTSKSYSIPMVPRDKKGKPMLPLNVGIMTVICLGDVCMREHFHTERYIFPVGYEVTRRYLSTIDPHAEVVYHCTILDGGDGPKFQIVPSDVPDRPVIAGTATGAWSNIVKQANAIRNRQHSNSVSGPDFFGLGQNTIKHLIQELPAADRLRDYVWQNFVEGGPLGGRHAAVIPALPEEYDAAMPIGAYYPSERDRERDRERERLRKAALEEDIRASLSSQASSSRAGPQVQPGQPQSQLQPGLTQIVLPPPTTSETLNIQEYQPPAVKESDRRVTRASASSAGSGVSLPSPTPTPARTLRKTSHSPRQSPAHSHHTRSSSNSSRHQVPAAASQSPYLAHVAATVGSTSPPPVPATFASIMNAYPAPASNASPQPGGSTSD